MILFQKEELYEKEGRNERPKKIGRLLAAAMNKGGEEGTWDILLLLRPEG